MNKRITWHEYFAGIALAVAERSTCDRKHVGAVIVKEKRILATGYNGSISSGDHCDDIGHLMIDNHCVRTVHAEMNAIAQSAKHGVSINNSAIYVTARPCWNCFKCIANSGINRVFYIEDYGTYTDNMIKIIDESHIIMKHLRSSL